MTREDPALPAQDGFGAFAALAAHQLGEAVALMRGAASVLEGQRSGLGAGGQDALRALGAGGERAQRYVDDLLDVVGSGGEVERPVAADLDAALDAALAEVESFLRRGAVKVRREPLPGAALHPREAQRLFAHLLRSALGAGATQMLVSGDAGPGAVIVRMLDDGTPPPPDAQHFEPLAPPRGRGPLVGAGVSLPVCRRLVERRGGTIAMDVRDDGATIVTLELPSPA